MEKYDTDALAESLLDHLREAIPSKRAWPEGEGYVRLVGQARQLVDDAAQLLVDGLPAPEEPKPEAADHGTVPEAASMPTERVPTQGQAPMAADQVPATEGRPSSADSDPAPRPLDQETMALRPGEIPRETLPPAAPMRPRLRVEIERNATEGTPYRSTVSVHADTGVSVSILACEIPDASGVSYDAGLLVGDTPINGDYPVRLTCAIDGDGTQSTVVAETVLVVNPNPRTLWKTLESDRDAPGWKPDQDKAHVIGAKGVEIVAASQRGRSHAHKGGFRDDDFAIRVTGPDGWNLIALADGAGSAERSRIGSRVAAQTAVNVAAAKLEASPSLWPITALEANPQDLTGAHMAAYQVLGAAAFDALKAIEGKSAEQGFPPRAYATTLLLAAHRRISGGELVATYWVGDGAIALFDTESDVVIMGNPDGGEYAGQTRFLDRDVMSDGKEIMSRLQIRVVPRFDAILLMTDGVSDPKFPSDAALHDTAEWVKLWAELLPILNSPDAAQQLTEWLGFWDVGNHDDRTIAVLR